MTRSYFPAALVAAALLTAASSLQALTEAEREQAWQALGVKEEAASQAAASQMAASLGTDQDATIKYVVAKLLVQSDAAMVQRRIAELDASDFRVREAAQAWLMTQGKTIEPQLKKAFDNTTSTEATGRLARMLARLTMLRRPEGAEGLRQIRAVQLLEGMDARAALKQIQDGSPWESTRDEATAALGRLKRRDIDAVLATATAQASKGEDAQGTLAKAREMITAAQLGEEEGYTVRLQQIASLVEATKRAQELEAKLKDNPADKALREQVIRVRLVDLDQPAEALKYADETTDGTLRKNLELASQDLAKLTDKQLVELADWYMTLSLPAGLPPKYAMLLRAQTCLQAYMERDISLTERVAVQKRLREVAGAMADIPGEPGWVDLLARIDPEKNVVAGTWKRGLHGEYTVESGDFCAMSLPAAPDCSYEMRIKWARQTGNDGIIIAFPIGVKRGNLNIGGWNNTVVGLEHINGQMADQQADNDVAKKEGIENGKVYDYAIRVEVKDANAKVTVMVDGQPYLAWSGPQAAFSMHGVWNKDKSLNVLLGAHRSKAMFKSVKIKLLEAGKLDERKAAPAANQPVVVPIGPQPVMPLQINGGIDLQDVDF